MNSNFRSFTPTSKKTLFLSISVCLPVSGLNKRKRLQTTDIPPAPTFTITTITATSTLSL